MSVEPCIKITLGGLFCTGGDTEAACRLRLDHLGSRSRTSVLLLTQAPVTQI